MLKNISLDWIGSVSGLAGAGLVMWDARAAAVVWIISNVAWIIWTLRTVRKPSIVAQQLGYLAINTATLVVRWNNP